ncbi:MAG TPA: hypothetical protein VK509_19410 [Polyangiales bacterium]|nr:hypothetical protein [Polyangiales bacterium]
MSEMGSMQKGAQRLVWIAACALLASVAPGCTGINPCRKQGLTEECDCAGGKKGVRMCLPERVWDHCACGEMPPAGGSSGAAGAGAGGMSGASGMSGMSGASGSSSGTGGSGGTQPDPDDDAGVDMAGSGGASGVSGGGGVGGGGTGGGAGSTTMAAAYKRCTSATECSASATCESTADPDDAEAMLKSCAPACTDKAGCPVPEGSYTAMVECVEGHCRLDCTPPLLEPELTCPSGMRCAATGLLEPSYCF